MEDFKCRVDIQVRFADTDALGHVNNAVYLQYLELARLEYLRRALNVEKTEEYGVILARVEIDYKSPAFHHETLVAGVRVIELGGASMKMEYCIEEKKSERLVAKAATVLVGYSYREAKVQRWPDWVREKVEAYDGIA